MLRRLVFSLFLNWVIAIAPAVAQTLTQSQVRHVVCAEAVWCDITSQIGGSAVTTQAIVVSPQADPHDVMTSPAMARDIAKADIVIVNGAEYDEWALRLAATSRGAGRETLDVGRLTRASPDANPHLFDDLGVVEAFAHHMTAELIGNQPRKAPKLMQRASAFDGAIERLRQRVVSVKSEVTGKRIVATEPVGGALFTALGLEVICPRFALAVMHHTEPAPRDLALVEGALETGQAAALIFNPAVTSPALNGLVDTARAHGVPVVPMSEMPMPGQHWQDWYEGRLTMLKQALSVR